MNPNEILALLNGGGTPAPSASTNTGGGAASSTKSTETTPPANQLGIATATFLAVLLIGLVGLASAHPQNA